MKITDFYLSKFDYALCISIDDEALNKYLKTNNTTFNKFKADVNGAINILLKSDTISKDQKIEIIDNLDKIKKVHLITYG